MHSTIELKLEVSALPGLCLIEDVASQRGVACTVLSRSQNVY
jgi:hypothetical protein